MRVGSTLSIVAKHRWVRGGRLWTACGLSRARGDDRGERGP